MPLGLPPSAYVRSMSPRRFSRMSPGASLRCRGCNKGVTATNFRADDLAEMLGWRRDADGDWCFTCQWRLGRTPRAVRRALRRSGDHVS